MLNRRQWMMGSASLAGAAQAGLGQGAGPKNIVISSANGTAPCAKAMEMLNAGADTLDAVIAGVNIIELDPNDTSVGYGGLPNEEGVVELDASVMHGPTRRCGAVAGIQTVKTPSHIAKLVMEKTTHVLLVGEGAGRFAQAWGYPKENLLTEKARLAWMVWKQSLRDASGNNNWAGPAGPQPGKIAELQQIFPHVSEDELAWAWQVAVHPTTGTINCLALNAKGEMSGVTTTSGLAWKIPGRVGDSPIIGAGLYVDQDVGAGGSTGLGEENIRISGAHTIVENMRHGMSPKDACLDALKRIARNYNDDRVRLGKFDIQFYALSKTGQYGGATLWDRDAGAPTPGARPTSFAVNDGGGASRLEPCAPLLTR
jgi:N4-(beta-N-acetylglucosaminyl)-L-asparaginase